MKFKQLLLIAVLLLIFPINAHATIGAVCKGNDRTQCGSGERCKYSSDVNASSVCEVGLGIREGCSFDFECGNPLTCIPCGVGQNKICAANNTCPAPTPVPPPVASGTVCTTRTICGAGQYCRPAAPRTCVKGPGVGTGCTGDEGCALGLICGRDKRCIDPAAPAAAPGNGKPDFTGVAQIGDLEKVFASVVTVFGTLIGFGFFTMMIVGGVKYLLSAGDPKALAAAKGTITWAILGLAFFAISYTILLLIKAFTGVDVTNFKITGY